MPNNIAEKLKLRQMILGKNKNDDKCPFGKIKIIPISYSVKLNECQMVIHENKK